MSRNGAIRHGRTCHPRRHRFLLMAALRRGHLYIAVSRRRLRRPPCRADRSWPGRRHHARDRCGRAGPGRWARGVRAGAGAGAARRDRIGLRGSSRARRLFCDVHALRLGFDVRRMPSGLCDHRGDGNWHLRRAKACRNATACQRRQSALLGTGARAGRTAPRVGFAPPTSPAIGVSGSVIA